MESGVSGKAVSLNGTNNYVQLSQEPALSGGFTFSAWVKERRPGRRNLQQQSVLLRVQPESENATNPFEAFVTLSNGNCEPRVQSGVASTVGQWFQVAVSWDGNSLKIYVNGQYKATSTRSGSLTSTTAEADIGRGQLNHSQLQLLERQY